MSKTYDVFVAEKIWGLNNGIPKASVSFTADYMKRLGKIKGKVPSYEDIVDTSVHEVRARQGRKDLRFHRAENRGRRALGCGGPVLLIPGRE